MKKEINLDIKEDNSVKFKDCENCKYLHLEFFSDNFRCSNVNLSNDFCYNYNTYCKYFEEKNKVEE